MFLPPQKVTREREREREATGLADRNKTDHKQKGDSRLVNK